jgi:hypothetical protein
MIGQNKWCSLIAVSLRDMQEFMIGFAPDERSFVSTNNNSLWNIKNAGLLNTKMVLTMIF